jgi:hypothetical protein
MPGFVAGASGGEADAEVQVRFHVDLEGAHGLPTGQQEEPAKG